MKILVVSQYFYPEQFRINDIVRELVKKGHKVTVLTGLPNYPDGFIYPGFERAYNKEEEYFGAKIYRCKLRPRKKGTLNLCLNYISFVRNANRKLKKISPDFDVVYVYEVSPIFQAIPAIKYGKRNRIPIVLYNMDIWPDCVRDRNDKPMSTRNPIYLISKHYSRYVYKNVDYILNKCDDFGLYLTDLFKISPNKMSTLYEHAETNYLSVSEKPIDNGVVDFMFLGNIGKSQNCDLIVDAFSRISSDNVSLHFVGSGSHVEALQKKVNDLGLRNVFFHGRKSLQETIDYYNLADVCILSLSNKTASGLTPPGKLFGYMAACRPILASINGSTQTIIQEAGCGYSCPADDSNDIYLTMSTILDNLDDLIPMGKKGRRFFLDHFTIDKHINCLEKELFNLVGRTNNEDTFH